MGTRARVRSAPFGLRGGFLWRALEKAIEAMDDEQLEQFFKSMVWSGMFDNMEQKGSARK
jgi:hypothetical protein